MSPVARYVIQKMVNPFYTNGSICVIQLEPGERKDSNTKLLMRDPRMKRSGLYKKMTFRKI